jgi:cytochrome P450
VEIDLLSAASFAHGQPHDQYRWLRANDPCYFHPEPSGPGFWAVTRYDDVRAIGRNAATFSSWPTMTIADVPGGDEHQMMISCDPPAHTAQRRLLNSRFTPRSASTWRHRIEELAVRIVDAVAERGECDLVADLAGEMPSFVIAELLGIPVSRTGAASTS